MKIKKPLVSIIVPVYNTEKYVERSIECILNQSYINIELILINDGSTDKSGDICLKYAKKDSRVKLLCQENKGVSAARNLGIDHSAGDYIQFVDSDDEIDKNMTETLLKGYLLERCNLSICGYDIVGRVRKKVVYEYGLYEKHEFLFLSYTDKQLNELILSSCNMLFDSNIIREYNMRFNSNYIMGEDGLFTLDYINKCKTISVINENFYKYNTYHQDERISTVSKFTIDLYELRLIYFKKLYYELDLIWNENEKNEMMHKFYDRLIADFIKVGAYHEYFIKKKLYKRLKDIVNDPLVINSSKVYKRQRKTDSVIIPFLMKNKFIKILISALKIRGNKFIKLYGKNDLVQSVYREGNNILKNNSYKN